MFFLTGSTGPDLAERLGTDKVELGIHPDFLDCASLRDPARTIGNLLNEVGTVQACRTHGLVWWFGLAEVLASFGILVDSSCIHPLQPFDRPLQLDSIRQFPIFWGDSWFINNADDIRSFPDMVNDKRGIRVFNFHPVHIAANTASHDDWLRIRPHLADPAALHLAVSNSRKSNGYGVRNMFLELLDMLSPEETITFLDALVSQEAE